MCCKSCLLRGMFYNMVTSLYVYDGVTWAVFRIWVLAEYYNTEYNILYIQSLTSLVRYYALWCFVWVCNRPTVVYSFPMLFFYIGIYKMFPFTKFLLAALSLYATWRWLLGWFCCCCCFCFFKMYHVRHCTVT